MAVVTGEHAPAAAVPKPSECQFHVLAGALAWKLDPGPDLMLALRVDCVKTHEDHVHGSEAVVAVGGNALSRNE